MVVPFTISCGECFFCARGYFSGCERSNPNAEMAAKLWGHSPAGLFGYSHLLGGFPGGQAEFLRVPYADVGPIKVPEGLSDEQALFLSDIFPTGYMGAEFCDIKGGETIAVFGCGPSRNSQSAAPFCSARNGSLRRIQPMLPASLSLNLNAYRQGPARVQAGHADPRAVAFARPAGQDVGCGFHRTDLLRDRGRDPLTGYGHQISERARELN